MQQERWKPIPRYRGRYEASNRGRIRSLWWGGRSRVTPFVMRLATIKSFSSHEVFYQIVGLSKLGVTKTELVHRLVLSAFRGPCPKRYVGAHLNGDGENNRLLNLRWVTRSENEQHKLLHKRSRSRLTFVQIRKVRKAWKAGARICDLAKN